MGVKKKIEAADVIKMSKSDLTCRKKKNMKKWRRTPMRNRIYTSKKYIIYKVKVELVLQPGEKE